MELPKHRGAADYIESRSERSGRSYPQPSGEGATSNEVVVLRTRRLQHSAVAYAVTRAAGIITAGLITLAGVAVLPITASAETNDGTLTVIVDRDVDRNGNYSSEIDQPQRDIEIVVTDAAGKSVQGVTGSDGRFVLRATPN